MVNKLCQSMVVNDFANFTTVEESFARAWSNMVVQGLTMLVICGPYFQLYNTFLQLYISFNYCEYTFHGVKIHGVKIRVIQLGHSLKQEQPNYKISTMVDCACD